MRHIVFSVVDKFSVAFLKHSFLQPCLALPSARMKQYVCKCFTKNMIIIIALTQVEDSGTGKEASTRGTGHGAARLLQSRNCCPVGLRMVSCHLPSPFHKKMQLSSGSNGAGLRNHPEGLPCCWRGRRPFRKHAPSC